MKKGAIIELGTSHSECLYSIFLFFKKSGYDVTLFLNEKLNANPDKFNAECGIRTFSFKGKRGTLKDYLAIKNILSTEGFTDAFFLSAGGVAVRNFLMMPMPRRLRTSGILHNTDKLTSSITDKFVFRRIKKFFVLADHMLRYLPSKYRSRTESIYTVYYPKHGSGATSVNKPANEFRIGIPGTVEFSRRDYKGLISELKDRSINSNVKFVLLGPGNYRDSNLKEVLQVIKNTVMENKFIHFENFLDDEEFYSNLSECDVLLPLIHPGREQYDKFIKYKISGTYNLSIGFRIPMLCHSSLSKIEDFHSTSLFYNYGGLAELINKLSSDKQYFKEQKSGLFNNPKWNFEFQRKKFINFIEKSEQ